MHFVVICQVSIYSGGCSGGDGVEDHTGLGVRISGSATSGTRGSSEAPSLALIKAGCFMWLVRDFEATASPTALTSSSSPVS